MVTVNIAELKYDLNRYLDEVKSGKEVVIRDRNHPIAKIIPLNKRDDIVAHVTRLTGEGKARLPLEPLPLEFWTEPRFRVSLKKLVAMVTKDRDEG
jgi:prevent-host-death family protein